MRTRKVVFIAVLLLGLVFTAIEFTPTTKANFFVYHTPKVLISADNISNNSVLEIQDSSRSFLINFTIMVENITYYSTVGDGEVDTIIQNVTIDCFVDGEKNSTKVDESNSLSRRYTYNATLPEGNHSIEVTAKIQLDVPYYYHFDSSYGSSGKIYFTVPKQPEQTSPLDYKLITVALATVLAIAVVSSLVYFKRHNLEKNQKRFQTAHLENTA
jgi:hypothetical protein